MSYYTGLPDAREDKRSNDLLNTQRLKTRSGHVLELNDNKGAEHITLQHRTGALLQFQADGSVRFVSQNGKMGLEINGEGYVNVTGAYLISAKSASITTEGDLDIVCHGNMSTLVDGTYTLLANNIRINSAEATKIGAQDFVLSTVETTKFTCGNYTSLHSDNQFWIKSVYEDVVTSAKVGVYHAAGVIIKDEAPRIDHN